jgi:hypothetical protein
MALPKKHDQLQEDKKICLPNYKTKC